MAKQYFNLNELVYVEKPKRKDFKNLENLVFERLTVLGYAGTVKGDSCWFCQCNCGNIIKIRAMCLTRKNSTNSCGCLASELSSKRNATHRMHNTPEYIAFRNLKSRCLNPNYQQYRNYGGRGIQVKLTFEEFLEEVGKRPSIKHSIDRINNNGHYEKGNIRWATNKEQSNNKRTSKIIVFNGKSLTISQWAREIGIKEATLFRRIKLGWCSECALSLPTLPEGANQHEHTCHHR